MSLVRTHRCNEVTLYHPVANILENLRRRCSTRPYDKIENLAARSTKLTHLPKNDNSHQIMHAFRTILYYAFVKSTIGSKMYA